MPYGQQKTLTQLITRLGHRRSCRPASLLAADGDTFDDAAVRFGRGRQALLIPDRRGFGRSDHRGPATIMTPTPRRRRDPQDANVTETVALVGFSMAAAKSRAASPSKAPNRVSKAVLISAVVPYMLKTGDNPNGVPQAPFDEKTAA